VAGGAAEFPSDNSNKKSADHEDPRFDHQSVGRSGLAGQDADRNQDGEDDRQDQERFVNFAHDCLSQCEIKEMRHQRWWINE
jgi:hypothetical protein